MKRRNLAICMILDVITLGLYGFYWMTRIADDTNVLAGPEKRISGVKVLLFGFITCGIYIYFWAWRMGKLLAGARIDRGFPPRNCKVEFLIWMFVAPPVSLALMQNEINKLNEPGVHSSDEWSNGRGDGVPVGGFREMNRKDADLPSGKGACAAGLAGSILFFILSLQLQPCFVINKEGVFRNIAFSLGPWFAENTPFQFFQLILLLAGICALGPVPVFVTANSGRWSRIWGRLAAAALSVLCITLLIYGICYERFFMGISYKTQLGVFGICMAVAMVASGVCCSGFCLSEYKYLCKRYPGYSCVMVLCAVASAMVTLLFLAVFVLSITGGIYSIPLRAPAYLPFLGRILVLAALFRLLRPFCTSPYPKT